MPADFLVVFILLAFCVFLICYVPEFGKMGSITSCPLLLLVVLVITVLAVIHAFRTVFLM